MNLQVSLIFHVTVIKFYRGVKAAFALLIVEYFCIPSLWPCFLPSPAKSVPFSLQTASDRFCLSPWFKQRSFFKGNFVFADFAPHLFQTVPDKQMKALHCYCFLLASQQSRIQAETVAFHLSNAFNLWQLRVARLNFV